MDAENNHALSRHAEMSQRFITNRNPLTLSLTHTHARTQTHSYTCTCTHASRHLHKLVHTVKQIQIHTPSHDWRSEGDGPIPKCRMARLVGAGQSRWPVAWSPEGSLGPFLDAHA